MVVSALVSCDSLYSPLFPILGGSCLPCDLTFQMNLGRLLIFQFVQLFTCCVDRVVTSKLLTAAMCFSDKQLTCWGFGKVGTQ